MPIPTFVVKDSGERATFAGGMVRDTEAGKVDYTTIFNGPMADRWAAHLSKAAAEKYADLPDGTPNWMQASGQAELIRFRKSAARHFRQWLRGDRDEDHASAVMFNLNGYEYVRDRMADEAAKDAAIESLIPASTEPDRPLVYDDMWQAWYRCALAVGFSRALKIRDEFTTGQIIRDRPDIWPYLLKALNKAAAKAERKKAA